MADYMMELAEGGELFSDLRSVGKYSLDLARFYAAQLVEILAFMHAPGRRVLHRDLKPENILLTSDRHIRLTDFGTARQLTSADEATNDDDVAGGPASAGRGSQHKKSRRGSFVGTAEYVSPEVLRDEMPGPSADLWSLGKLQTMHTSALVACLSVACADLEAAAVCLGAVAARRGGRACAQGAFCSRC
jgi:3-phosphoinositide dependent protein kinase-1